MNAGVWGAHTTRVLAMTFSSSRTFSSPGRVFNRSSEKIVSARPPKPAREPRALLRVFGRTIWFNYE